MEQGLVLWTDEHRTHDPRIEVQGGERLPAFDQPARVEEVLAAIADDPRLQVERRTGLDSEAVPQVHDVALLRFFEHCERDLPADQVVFADTFLHPLLRDDDAFPDPDTRYAIGRYCFDTITGISHGSIRAARAATALAASAAQEVRDGRRLAIALTRPPGHHVSRRLFGGGCYLNSVATAAETLLAGGAAKVAILDIDVHHGNGTQALFYERPDVLFVSLHGHPIHSYPYFTGFPDEEGAGAGRGTNLNLTLALGEEHDGYLEKLERRSRRSVVLLQMLLPSRSESTPRPVTPQPTPT